MPDLASTRLVDLNVLDDDEALRLFTKVVGDAARGGGARGHRRAAGGLRRPAAGHQDLRGAAGHPQRLDHRVHGAGSATSTGGWTSCGPGTWPSGPASRSASPACPRAARRTRIAPADAFRLLGLWQGPSISSAAAAALFGAAGAPGRGRPGEPGGRAPAGVHRSRAGTSSTTCSGSIRPNGPTADLPGPARDAALGRLLSWYMRTADAAATAVSPHRYDMPLAAATGEHAPLVLRRRAGRSGLVRRRARQRGRRHPPGRRVAACTTIAWRLPLPLFIIFHSRNNWVDCIATHRIALDSARQVGNRQGEAWVLNNLGEALGSHRDSEGIGYLERSLAIRHEIGDRMGEAQAANNLADAYQAGPQAGGGRAAPPGAGAEPRGRLPLRRRRGPGQPGRALLGLDRADGGDRLSCSRPERTFTEIGYPDGIGYALYCLGSCYASLGRDADALDCLRQALSQSPGFGKPAPAGGHAAVPRPASRPTTAWPPRPVIPGARPRRSSTNSATRRQAAEVRAEHGGIRHFLKVALGRVCARYDAARLPASSSGEGQENERTVMGNVAVAEEMAERGRTRGALRAERERERARGRRGRGRRRGRRTTRTTRRSTRTTCRSAKSEGWRGAGSRPGPAQCPAARPWPGRPRKLPHAAPVYRISRLIAYAISRAYRPVAAAGGRAS